MMWGELGSFCVGWKLWCHHSTLLGSNLLIDNGRGKDPSPRRCLLFIFMLHVSVCECTIGLSPVAHGLLYWE
jgi:hypothetical protein